MVPQYASGDGRPDEGHVASARDGAGATGLTALDGLLTAIVQGKEKDIAVSGMRGGAVSLLISRIADRLQRPLLVITPSEAEATILEQDLELFTTTACFTYPSYDVPPYTPLSPDPGTMASRLAALYRLIAMPRPQIAIVAAEALLRRTLPKELFAASVEYFARGEDADQQDLARRLTALGYQMVSLVQNAGECSVRGGIVDIFAAGTEVPLRLDFFGDTLESIRSFDPISQRSIDELEECILLPCRDILLPANSPTGCRKLAERFRQLGSDAGWDDGKTQAMAEQIATQRLFPGVEFFQPLFFDTVSAFADYLPREAVCILTDDLRVNAVIRAALEKIQASYLEARDHGNPALPPAALFLTEEEAIGTLAPFPLIRLLDFPRHGLDLVDATATVCPEPQPVSRQPTCTVTTTNHLLLRQKIDMSRKTQGLLAPLAETMTEWLSHGDRVFIACRSDRHARHMEELLKQYQLRSLFPPKPIALLPATEVREIQLVDHPLSAGFDLPELRLHILSENELFGGRLKVGKRRRRTTSAPPVSFDELNPGDIVVHATHGLGIYEGIANMTLMGIANDYIVIRYQDDDKLYIPVDRLGAVTKYKGLADTTPRLDKLGSKSWDSTKRKVKEAVSKVAQELLELYARRKITIGHSFSEPDELFQELEESFPFDETSGQSKAINEVLDDLCGGQSMDRLVCGDVGYGKTEVAVRASFKVITDNFQVAILVPTTVLAEQHTETFRERFHGFPVRVETLSRFRSPAEQREILQGLAAGTVDLVIGTHRLLSKDVIFKRLGLLIIDEEHRFGVKHKEKLKALKVGIDILTLTATPIPRTLQLSLLGIRDLSVISTPPALRRSVKTFIAEYDDMIVREAVNREIYRGGQCFVVHNRVSSIHDMAKKILTLSPEARVAVAHGQMPPKILEEIMVKFVRKEINVLVCTTIIESGLDIPNANTIIITRADRFGLADIYQLRGRVGRSTEQAYAYLLMPTMDGLPKEAQQRLRALMDYSELGGGFKLALSDLQIRGGGNILGVSQSGNIAAVGYDLYLDLLQKTIEDMRRGGLEDDQDKTAGEVDPEITLRISAFIPAQYISDTAQRYFAYRKLTSVRTEEELADCHQELRDRYGEPPVETQHLFDIIELKIFLRTLRVAKLEQGPGNLVFTFQDATPINPQKILLFLKDQKNKARITPDSRLIVHVAATTPAEILGSAKKILLALT